MTSDGLRACVLPPGPNTGSSATFRSSRRAPPIRWSRRCRHAGTASMLRAITSSRRKKRPSAGNRSKGRPEFEDRSESRKGFGLAKSSPCCRDARIEVAFAATAQPIRGPVAPWRFMAEPLAASPPAIMHSSDEPPNRVVGRPTGSLRSGASPPASGDTGSDSCGERGRWMVGRVMLTASLTGIGIRRGRMPEGATEPSCRNGAPGSQVRC